MSFATRSGTGRIDSSRLNPAIERYETVNVSVCRPVKSRAVYSTSGSRSTVRNTEVPGGIVCIPPMNVAGGWPPTPGAVLDRGSRRLRREEEGVFSVHDWAEVSRLYHRERLSKAAIARRLGMSRQTVMLQESWV